MVNVLQSEGSIRGPRGPKKLTIAVFAGDDDVDEVMMMLLRIDKQCDMGSRLKLLAEPHTETLKTRWLQWQCHQQNVKYFMPMVGDDGGDGDGMVGVGVDGDGDCGGGGGNGYGGGGGDVRDGVGGGVLTQQCNHS